MAAKNTRLLKALFHITNFGFRTFRWRILLSFILVSVIPLSIFYIFITQSIESYFIESRCKELRSQARITASQVSLGNYLFDENKLILLDTELKRAGEANNYRIIVTDRMGIVISDSSKATDVDGTIIQGYVGKTFTVPEVMEAFNKNDIYKLYPDDYVSAGAAVLDKNSSVSGAVLIYGSSADIAKQLSGINSLVLIFTLTTGVIIFALSYWMSKIIIDPLKNILKVIQRMSEGHLSQRVKVKGKNEISELGASFNTMAERLEKVDQIRREFVSNVSHELKTPLSSMKVLAESILFQEQVPEEMYKEFLSDIKNEVDRMTDIINDLLDLVKLDRTSAELKLSSVNLNKMVEDIIKRLSPLATQKDIDLVFGGVKEVTAQADEVKLSLAITNLIENGIKYTHYDGRVTITIDADHQNAFIQISDTGIGMAEEEITKIFERFYRVDKTRDRETGGSGLGLAITHSVILMHNGSIRVTSKENEGSVFYVRIPLIRNNSE